MNTPGMNEKEQCYGFQFRSGMTRRGSGCPVRAGMTKGMTTPPDSSLRSRMTRGRRWGFPVRTGIMKGTRLPGRQGMTSIDLLLDMTIIRC